MGAFINQWYQADVKEKHDEELNAEDHEHDDGTDGNNGNKQLRRNPTRRREMPLRYRTPNMTVYMHEYVQQGNLIESRRQEINGLLERGVFSIFPRSDAERHRIYGEGFVDQIRTKDFQQHSKNLDL